MYVLNILLDNSTMQTRN